MHRTGYFRAWMQRYQTSMTLVPSSHSERLVMQITLRHLYFWKRASIISWWNSLALNSSTSPRDKWTPWFFTKIHQKHPILQSIIPPLHYTGKHICFLFCFHSGGHLGWAAQETFQGLWISILKHKVYPHKSTNNCFSTRSTEGMYFLP